MTQDRQTQQPQWHWAEDDSKGWIPTYTLEAPDGTRWGITKDFAHPDKLLAELNAQQQRIVALNQLWMAAVDERDHNKAALKQAEVKVMAMQAHVEALEAALRRVHCYRNGYCRDCGEFTGWDAIQEIQGDEPHAQYCHVGRELALLSPSEAK